MLAQPGPHCQSGGMAQKRKQSAGGGFFIAAGAMVGVIAGRYFGGQTTIGLLAGLATGFVIALIMWLSSRR
jgi:hypothetical protein